MTQAMMPLMKVQNGSMIVHVGGEGRWKAKRLQSIDPTMVSANSNHCSAAILHTTRSMIKYNLAVKISELTNKHEAHEKARDMENGGD